MNFPEMESFRHARGVSILHLADRSKRRSEVENLEQKAQVSSLLDVSKNQNLTRSRGTKSTSTKVESYCIGKQAFLGASCTSTSEQQNRMYSF